MLNPRTGQNIGSFLKSLFSRLGKEEGLSLRIEDLRGRSKAEYSAADLDMGMKPRVTMDKGTFGRVMEESYNPKDFFHRETFQILRHELYHHAYATTDLLKGTAGAIGAAGAKSPIGRLRDKTTNQIFKRIKEKGASFGMTPAQTKAAARESAIEELSVESSARRTSAAMGSPYQRGMFGLTDPHREYGITQQIADEVGSVLKIGEDLWPGIRKSTPGPGQWDAMKRKDPNGPGGDFPGGRLDSVLQAAKPYKGWGVLAGTVAALWGSYQGLSWMFGGDPEAEYLSASWLGKRGNRLEEALFDETEQFDARTMATIRGGTHFHEMIQEIFELEGAETEVKIVDKSLGVKGYVDVLLPGNIPVEVKTISSTGFDRLGRPLEAHTSQVNFYMHGRQAQYGYVVYLDGMDISRRKVFRVGYQPGRLIADVEEARNRMLSHPNRMTNDNIKWLTQTHSMDPAYLRGIRHSSGHASSFDSIKPSAEFPGGRVSSIDQASKYRDLGNVDHTPTMGLTIRKHETAIGHRSRGNSTKRVGGQNHANGSRRYR